MPRKLLFSLLILAHAVTALAQIGFIENKGQFDEPIVFRAQFDGHQIYLDKEPGVNMLWIFIPISGMITVFR